MSVMMIKNLLSGACLFISAVSIGQTDGAVSCSSAKSSGLNKLQQINWPKNAGLELYDVKYHKLDIAMRNNSIYIEGKVTTQALVTGPQMSDFVFELHPSLTLDSVKVNGLQTVEITNGTFKECALTSPIPANTMFTAEIWYHGTPTFAGPAAIGVGIATAQSWGNRVTWTLSQPYSAFEWWPCKQSLNDKIDSIDVWITVGDSLKAGSNGLLKQITPIAGNRLRYEWKHRYPIDYYLISAAVAKYVDYSFYAYPNGLVDSVLIQNYIYDNPQTLPYFKTQIDLTKNFIEEFAQLYGAYPFEQEKYGHCMAPLGGGMEHQTMTSQGSFSFELTSHELAHQWFGDMVTCASWKDIWVNEGFASYSEYLMLQILQPGQALTKLNDYHELALSEVGGSVYVDDTTNPDRIFSSRLTYTKGATLVHMLRFLVNDDAVFFQSLRNYLQAHAYGTATGEDVKTAIENAASIDLDHFFEDYYYGEGYPTFSLRWRKSPDGKVYLKLTQTASKPNVTPLFRIPVEIRFSSPAGDTTLRVMSNAPEVFFDFEYARTVNTAQIDPNQWILNMTGPIIQDNTLDIDTQNLHNVSIYPNPSNDKIFLSGFQIGESVSITGLDGKVIRTFQITQDKQAVSLDDISAGSYIISGKSGNYRFVKSK
jgi:aminopeptidase N